MDTPFDTRVTDELLVDDACGAPAGSTSSVPSIRR